MHETVVRHRLANKETEKIMAEMEDWALGVDEEDEDAMINRYLIFHVGDEDYGIGIEYVIEIIGLQKVTEVPDMPKFVKGVINLRGQVIPVIDVRSRFKLPEIEYNERTCVIVVKVKDAQIGLIVDGVAEVQQIMEDQISPPPSIQQGASGRYIEGMGRIGEEVKILLDIQKLLYEEELEALTTNNTNE